jgi:hypothetical protein
VVPLTIALQLFLKSKYNTQLKYKMGVLQSIILSLGSSPMSIVLKIIPYKESSQIWDRRFAELLCVWCGSVSYPGAVVCVVW